MEQVDAVVVGAGVIGLAVGRSLAKRGLETVILEAQEDIGTETSARNSEVIHAGIYYPEGSLKAQMCVAGKERLYAFCEEFHVPHRRCGKIIVAATKSQLTTVRGYIEQAAKNGVTDLYELSAADIASLEPALDVVGGVMSPSTGIIDSHQYMLAMQGDLLAHGGMLAFNTKVQGIVPQGARLRVMTDTVDLSCGVLINAAGHGAPELAQHLSPAPKGYYAIGHYYSYAAADLFKHLIYPVAQAGGLGVHVTLDLAGQIRFGPDVRWIDQLDYRFDDSHRQRFIEAIRAYFPGLEADRLQPGYTGIRPKLRGPADPAVDDFVVSGPADHGVKGLVHLLGIESPGITGSLALAEHAVEVALSD